MKRIITVLCAFIAVAVQAQVRCHIEGELRDTIQGKTVVICPANVDIRVSDNYITAKADTHGRFSCDVETDKMELYDVFLHEQWEQGAYSINKFLIEDSTTVRLSFNDDKWKIISGGPEQTQKIEMDAEAERLYLSKMNAIESKVKAELEPRIAELKAQDKNPEEDSLLMKRYQEFMAEYEKIFNEYRSWELEYYAAYPMQYSLYDIADKMMYRSSRHDEQKTKLMDLYHSAYENFHPETPVHNTIRTQEAEWKLKPGKPYIDFEARTVDGRKVQVSSLYKGKVAVIDLWASWCGPCRKHSHDLIPIYEKYKDKGFTVVGIARESEVSHMIKAAEKDGYPWQNLIDLKDEFGVWQKNGLTFSGGGMFLVDRDGTILSTSTNMEELEPLIRKALRLTE